MKPNGLANYPEWKRAMRLYMKARPSKTVPEIINRVAEKSCWRALELTPKANTKQFPLGTESTPVKGNNSRGAQLYYALASKQGYRKGAGIRKAAKAIKSRRKSASGAIKAGFFNSIKAFGGVVRNKRFVGGSGTVSKSFGKPARKGFSIKKIALSMNLVDGAGVVAKGPMDRAIRQQIVDMQEYAIKKLQRADNKFSAKRR